MFFIEIFNLFSVLMIGFPCPEDQIGWLTNALEINTSTASWGDRVTGVAHSRKAWPKAIIVYVKMTLAGFCIFQQKIHILIFYPNDLFSLQGTVFEWAIRTNQFLKWIKDLYFLKNKLNFHKDKRSQRIKFSIRYWLLK